MLTLCGVVVTELIDHREFESRLERALKAARARETSYALLYIDLDRSELVSDSCGQSAGDDYFGQVAALFKSKLRWRDTLATLGDHKFGAVLECDFDEAVQTAEALRSATSEFTFKRDKAPFTLTVSIGVVPITAENDDVAALRAAADSACAHARDAGGNRVHSLQPHDIDQTRRQREMQWAARITDAMQDNRFELYRQTILPLHEAENGSHYEIVLRIRDENGDAISPGDFMGAAERYDIVPSIDRWVIRNTFRWLASEASERECLFLCSINLSRKTIGDERFLPFVLNQFETTGLDATKICFEITETAPFDNRPQADCFIKDMRDLGCKFALDNFGTGSSSFSDLKHLPVDFLKIDGSFVKNIPGDSTDREILLSIAQIGRLAGKQTIAKLADNEEIISMLRSMNIDYAQGSGVSKLKRVPLENTKVPRTE